MNWFKIAQSNITDKIKKILKNHSFVQKLMNDYGIPLDEIDKYLEIEIKELDGKNAEGNGRKITLDKELFKNDFFHDNFHFVIHEFFHWLKRRYEKKFYFNDTEEIQSFVLAITWEMINNKSKDHIIASLYPIVKNQFNNENKAEEIFNKMLEEAEKLHQVYLKK